LIVVIFVYIKKPDNDTLSGFKGDCFLLNKKSVNIS